MTQKLSVLDKALRPGEYDLRSRSERRFQRETSFEPLEAPTKKSLERRVRDASRRDRLPIPPPSAWKMAASVPTRWAAWGRGGVPLSRSTGTSSYVVAYNGETGPSIIASQASRDIRAGDRRRARRQLQDVPAHGRRVRGTVLSPPSVRAGPADAGKRRAARVAQMRRAGMNVVWPHRGCSTARRGIAIGTFDGCARATALSSRRQRDPGRAHHGVTCERIRGIDVGRALRCSERCERRWSCTRRARGGGRRRHALRCARCRVGGPRFAESVFRGAGAEVVAAGEDFVFGAGRKGTSI